jgi:hypothetical protein
VQHYRPPLLLNAVERSLADAALVTGGGHGAELMGGHMDLALAITIAALAGFVAGYLTGRAVHGGPEQGAVAAAKAPAVRDTERATEELAALRQNLRVKCGHDEAKVDRLIEAERRRVPEAPEVKLIQAAIDRWERDNR